MLLPRVATSIMELLHLQLHLHVLLAWPAQKQSIQEPGFPENISLERLVFSLVGKAASGVFWWLGIGWYQFVTLISWLNVFLLTR